MQINTSEMSEDDIAEFIEEFSMYSEDAIKKIRHHARQSKGAIVEIGSYIGGGTCAIGDAVRGQDRPFFVLEVGGSYPDQPNLPTEDILKDLNKNLESWGLKPSVEVIPRLAHEGMWDLRSKLAGRKIGFLVIDADGQVSSIVQMLSPMIADDCVLVLDDYSDKDKGGGVVKFIDNAEKANCIEKIETDNEISTWFGKFVRSPSELPPAAEFNLDEGYSYYCYPPCFERWDDEAEKRASKMKLYEDGVLLEPSHAKHNNIRKFGGGRYSYWIGKLYFSASDNSNPNENGKKYSIKVGEHEFKLN